MLVADSSTSDLTDIYRTQLRDMPSSWSTQILYSGLNQRRLYSERMSNDCSIPSEVISFALFGDPGHNCTGANRNSIFLSTLGHQIVSVDDDIICRIGRVPDPSVNIREIQLGGDNETVPCWFFEDRQSATNFVEQQQVGMADLHELLLGRSLKDVTATGANYNHACHHVLNDLANNSGHVALTALGLVGDSGMQTGEWLPLIATGHTRKRILQSPETYAMAQTSREMARQVSRYTVWHSGQLMTTCVGFDNARILPPFLPVHRNEDGIFASTLERLLPTYYVGHIPFTVEHSPIEDRLNAGLEYSRLRLSDVILWTLAHWEGLADIRPRKRFNHLGAFLIEVGTLSPVEFKHRMRECYFTWQHNLIGLLQTHIVAYKDSPAFWREDLLRRIESLRVLIRKRVLPVLLDSSEPMSIEASFIQARHLVRRFGEVVYWWPDILDSARNLARDNCFPYQRIR